MPMILVLRVISQICQCFEDKEQNQKKAQSEKEENDYPLYLMNKGMQTQNSKIGSEVGEKEEFLKTLQTLTSKRSLNQGYKELIASDTKRTIEGFSIPELYTFPAEADENGESTTKRQVTPMISPHNVVNVLDNAETEEEVTNKGRFSQPQRPSAQQQPKNNLLILIQQQPEGTSRLEEQDINDIGIEDNQQNIEQGMEQDEEEDFEYFQQDLNAINRKHSKPKQALDLETRVKRHRNKKRKAKPTADSAISPYRVNLPKDLQNFAISNRPDQ